MFKFNYIVYKITNKINGKVYVGCTSKTLEQRWKKHLESINKPRHSHDYKAANMTQKQIAVKYSVCVSTIEKIIANKYWSC